MKPALTRRDRRRATQRIAAAALAGSVPALALGQATPNAAPAQTKVQRYAFLVAETSMDPVKLSDLYSRVLTSHVFEALYKYDHLARPIKIKPLTADSEAVPSPADLLERVLALRRRRHRRPAQGAGMKRA